VEWLRTGGQGFFFNMLKGDGKGFFFLKRLGGGGGVRVGLIN